MLVANFNQDNDLFVKGVLVRNALQMQLQELLILIHQRLIVDSSLTTIVTYDIFIICLLQKLRVWISLEGKYLCNEYEYLYIVCVCVCIFISVV